MKSTFFHKSLLFLLIILLLAGRLLLIDKGLLEDSDEFSFLFLIIHFDELINLNMKTWANTMFHASSTIPETFIRLTQIAFLKAYAAILNIPATSTKALSLIGFFNALVSVFNLYIFYKLLVQLKFSRTMAITGLVLLGCTVNFNLYIRHILPYETGLMFQLLAVYNLTKEELTDKSVLKSGIFSALGFSNYFGYFMFVFILIGYIFTEKATIQSRIKKSAYFLAPFVAFTLLIELLSQMAGDSYIMHMLLFADTVIQGSPSEGLIFIFKYFYQVEKFMGIVLLTAFGLAIVLKLHRKEIDSVFNLMTLSILAYLIFGSYVYFSEKMVFYGRVLHMYYPFVVMGTVYFFSQFKYTYWAIIPLGLLNFGITIIDLNSLGYPRSIINKYAIQEGESISLNYVNELECAIDYQKTEYLHFNLPRTQPKLSGNITLVNFCFFNHFPDGFIETYQPYIIIPHSEKILDKPHFMSHKAYGFEYYTKEGRSFICRNMPKIRILKQVDLCLKKIHC